MENLEDGLTRCGYNILIGCVLHIVDLFRVFAVIAHDKLSRNYVYLNEGKISFLNSSIFIYTNRIVILGVYNIETNKFPDEFQSLSYILLCAKTVLSEFSNILFPTI